MRRQRFERCRAACRVLTGLVLLGWCTVVATAGPPAAVGDTSLEQALGTGADGFARALAPHDFVFPRDHGPHPDYRTEWWYFTGNLRARDGRRFGFELTFFRVALAPSMPVRHSEWATDQIYMAHFALTDVRGARFYHDQRMSRAALELAGARAQPFRVWLEDWSAAVSDKPLSPTCLALGPPQRCLNIHVQARTPDAAIDLQLEALKPLVLQGDAGLSRKSAVPGSASYYYSFTRLASRGVVTVGGEAFEVEGLSWMDREWSTSALGPEQAGWDWFALQLDDGTDVMFYRLRRKDGTVDPFSAGVVVDARGKAHKLSARAVDIDVLRYWRSPHSGVRYPMGWRLSIPAARLEFELQPYLEDQELYRTTVRYWEGAVRVTARHDGHAVGGHGYVELAGYGP